MMENKATQPLPTRTETLQRYHNLTSPLVALQAAQQQESLKQEFRNNASMRLEHIKNRSSKIYALDSNSQAELKASSILYQIPEFSTPEVNYQVAEHIRKKVEEIKNQVITHLPEISKSSNYAPKKLQHQLNHRSAVRELEDWLKISLKNPPTTSDDTIQYKNMIMGVGMKELIRIISKRCNEEGRIAQEIWQLTWGICREIILYLSQRAKKCEDLLDEELKYIRLSYEQEFKSLQQENKDLKDKVASLQAENKEFFQQLTRIRKRKDLIQQQNKALSFDNFHLQGQIKNILQQNLAIYLQIGDKSKRGWVKKMYKSIANSPSVPSTLVNGLYQHQITETVEQRNKIQQITEELTDILSKQEIQNIGHEILQDLQRRKSIRQQKRLSRDKNMKKNKKSKKTKDRESIAYHLTEATETVQNHQEQNHLEIVQDHIQEESVNSDNETKRQCEDLIKNMKQEFKPANAGVQTQTITMIHAYASTPQVVLLDFSASVEPYHLTDFDEIGVNTEDQKEDLKLIKKKGKQNTREDVRSKSKIYTGSVVNKEKSKYKPDKDKKLVLDTVHEVYRQKLESNEQDQEEFRLYDHKSALAAAEQETKKLMTSSKIKNQEERFSQASSSEMRMSRQGEGKVGLFVQDPQKNNKIISIFKKSESVIVDADLLINNSSVVFPKAEEKKQKDQGSQISYQKKQYEKLPEVPLLSKDKEIPLQSPQTQIRQSQPPIVKVNDIEVKQSEVKEPKSKISRDTKPRESKQKNYKKLSPSGKLNQTAKSNDSNFKPFEPATPNEDRRSSSPVPKEYFCANCHHSISQTEPKFLKEQISTDYMKSPKRASDKHLKDQLSSLKKLPFEVQEQEDFVRRRMKKLTTRNSSGFNHDISFKRQIEVHLRSPFSREEDLNDNTQQIQEPKPIFVKISPFKWMVKQLQASNKDFINSIVHILPQNSENLQQYLQVVREVNQISDGKVTMTDKYAISTIERNVFPILNELLAPVRKAVKFNRIADTMKMFTSLASIVFNRISRKYGVKILAIKHLKILLSAFKAASKFTDKYKTIELMMFTDCKSPQSQDLFVYLLVMGLFDPTFSASKTLTLDQALTVRQICEEHLSKENQVYGGDWWDRDKESTGVDIGELVRSIITNYRLLKINRIQQLGFVFLMLKKQNCMDFKDFVYFMSSFKMDLSLKLTIIKKLLSFCDIKSKNQTIGITENTFAKFLTSCQEFTLNLLEQTLEEQIFHNFKDKATYSLLETKMFNANFAISKDTSHVTSNDEVFAQNNLQPLHVTTSTPDIRSQKDTFIAQYQTTCKKQRIAHYMRHYSSFTYQICKFLYNKEETKYLTARQKGMIKQYLMLHILEAETENTVGIVDYFSDSMMGLMWTPIEDFSIENNKV